MNILLVEDDMDIGNGVRIALSDLGMSVIWVRRCNEALQSLQESPPDIVLLDLGLPDGDGITLLRRLRRDREPLPVLIMTARDALGDRLLGLDSGADDYLVKPFALAELVSRVRALARRSYGYRDDTLEVREIAIHVPTMRVTVRGRLVDLSPSEYQLLCALVKRADRVLTRRMLEELVLQEPGSDSNALEVHVSNLRRKIGEGFIRTVRGIGLRHRPHRAAGVRVRLRTLWRALTEPSLTRRLLLAQMGLLVALWLASIGYFVYDTAYVNDWYQPRQMRERADMILSVIDGMADRPGELRRALTQIDQFQRDENRENDDEGVRVSLNAWLGDQLLYATPGKPGVVQVSRFDELETSVQDGRRIRSFARSSVTSDARVVVILPADADPYSSRSGPAASCCCRCWSRCRCCWCRRWYRCGWRCVRFVSWPRRWPARATHDLEPLAFRARHRELRPLVRSVNDLLRRIRAGLLRERRFVADAAHELRTPIAAVGLNVEAMQERMADSRTDPAATRSLLASLASSSQRASRLVAQLLALMRSDAPRAASDPQAVQALGERAQECLAAAAPLARHTDVDLELQCAGSGPYVPGDREGLDSLLQNLIENAIKYSPPRGRVLVGIEPAAAGAVLTVSDEGPGIPAEFRERVFERFYRVPSQSHAGSGLGLAIVKSVADRLGATVSLATPPWGHGLQVRVVFPQGAAGPATRT